MRTIRIGNHSVGSDQPVFVIAEAGSNHDRKLEQAKRLVEAAAESGADAVKFQTFRAEKIVASGRDRASYLDGLVGAEATMRDLFRSLELPIEWHGDLAAYAQQCGLEFLSTPFDEESADLLEQVGVPAYKIASFELWHLPLLEHVARKGKPLLLSTGMAGLGDIEDALNAVYRAGNDEVALLHCAIAYPVAFENIHLRAMHTMELAFDVPVGFSDHSPGVTAAVAATALGARIIEKHFTLDRSLPGPDHPFALNPPELAAMVRGIREAEKALGSPRKLRTQSEEEFYELGRRSLFAVVDIPAGATIRREMIAVLRPGTGLMPKYLEAVVGRVARRNISRDDPITWDLI